MGRGNSQEKQGGQCGWNRASEREQGIDEVHGGGEADKDGVQIL